MRLTQKQLENDYNISIIKSGKKYLISLNDTNHEFKNLTELKEFMDTQEVKLEDIKNDNSDNTPNFDDFIKGIKSSKTKEVLEKTVKNQVENLKQYYSTSSLSTKISEYRKELKNVFSDTNDIPEIFKNISHKGNTEHLAISLTYKYLPRNEIEKMIQDRKVKSNEKANKKHPITKEDINNILTIAKKGIYQREDIYFAIASLELLTGRRFIENASLLNDFDRITNFKILVKRTELAKKHDEQEELIEMMTLDFADGIIDCIEWIRSNFDVSDLTKKQVTDRYLGRVNDRVKTYFSDCFKHGSDYPTSHTLRAYSVNIAWYWYGNKKAHKATFIADYLGHDNELSAKEYDRYYIDEDSFNNDEKQGYKAYLLDNDDEIKLPFSNVIISPSELFKIEHYGLDNLISVYEKTSQTSQTSKNIKGFLSPKDRKNIHFDVLKNCVDLIIKYNEDKEKEDKIAITSRAIYDVTGKRTPIISDFINNSDYAELISQYNNDNNFGQKQNMGKDIKKRLGL